jgi:hypothetical protein
LLHKLDSHQADMPSDLRSDILVFYQDLSLPIATKTNESDWARLQEELMRLAAVDQDLSAASAPAPATSGAPAGK